MSEESQKKNSSHYPKSRIIEAEQKSHASITAFCEYYGLRYTSVMYYLRKGKTGDEVLSIMRQKPASSRYSKAPGRSVPVKIGDDTFQSISEAAMAYGVSSAQIEKAIEEGDANPAFPDMNIPDVPEEQTKRMKPCVVAGVSYPSQAAAARKYGVPLVTVYSRMQREHISFEEAVRRGHIERRQILPEKTKWNGQGFEPFDGVLEEMKITKDIFTLLDKNAYHPQLLINQEKELFAIRIQESLEAITPPLDVYIVFSEKNASQDIEFIIPVLGKLRILSNVKQTLLHQQINEANGNYTGSKIFLQDGIFSAAWSFAQTSRSLQITFFMRTLYRFIGSTSAMWDTLKWAEKEVALV